MSDHKMESMKGRAEEAIGTATNDKDLERKGKIDQAAAAAKAHVDNAGDKIKDAIDHKK